MELRLLALGLFPGAGVFEGDQAFREGLVFEQGKFALREAAGEERDAFADQDRNDSDIKLVDEVFFEEVAGEFTAAHQPDVFSGALAEFLEETFWGFVDEGDAATLAGRLGMGEDVAFHFRVADPASAHLGGHVVGLAPHDGGIDGGEEWPNEISLGNKEKATAPSGRA